MSAPKLELHEPLERLNYYNSQRLEAIDFRLEQAYHMRVRRELNRAMYTFGIGAGLEVREHPTDTHSVQVGPGLALDPFGREIILFEPRTIKVCGTPRRADGVTFGNYLVIAYREEKVAPRSDGCAVIGVYPTGTDACGCKGTSAQKTNSCGGQCHGSCGCGGAGGCGCGGTCQCGATESQAYAWGAPSRIRSEPMLMFQDAWPSESSGKLLLAQVELSEDCRVLGIKSGMRRYASASKPPTVTPVSLAGEKDIDSANPKVLHFHIDGGFPDTVKLYLRGSKFSSLFYTEMGKHTHVINATTDIQEYNLKHTHEVVESKIQTTGAHAHKLRMEDEGNTLETDTDSPEWRYDGCATDGEHTHALETLKLNEKLDLWKHNHKVTASAENAGVTNTLARDGQPAHGYLNGMTIFYITGNSSVDITADVLAQLQAVDPGSWTKLGDGQPGHALNTKGTPAIDLRQISGIDLGPGGHALQFSVPPNTGGQLAYNLYVS